MNDTNVSYGNPFTLLLSRNADDANRAKIQTGQHHFLPISFAII